MKTQMKQAWVDALRSGKYKQGREKLKQVNEKGKSSYCCLGVLCDLNNVKFVEAQDCYGYKTIAVGKQLDDCYPTESMGKKWGLSRRVMETLAEMNDEGKSFKTIAKYIEKNL